MTQADVFEALAFLGPELAAICAGFAIVWFDGLYLTPAGEAYLDNLGE